MNSGIEPGKTGGRGSGAFRASAASRLRPAARRYLLPSRFRENNMSAAGVKPEPTTKGVVPFLKIPKEGQPYLAGSKCSKCGEVVVGSRNTCGKCGAREGVEAVKLGTTGK